MKVLADQTELWRAAHEKTRDLEREVERLTAALADEKAHADQLAEALRRLEDVSAAERALACVALDAYDAQPRGGGGGPVIKDETEVLPLNPLAGLIDEEFEEFIARWYEEGTNG